MGGQVLLLLVSQLLSVSCSSLHEEGHQEGAAGEAGGRDGRSLVNSFPFTEARPAKQYDDGPAVDFNSVADASASGQRCIDKIINEEETEYDEVYECNHSYNRRCTTSYTTTYEAQQEEECEENYKKNCFIEYSQTAYDTVVEVCVEPLVKDCGATGPEVCSTEYQAECETVQEEHEVEDDVVECREEVESKCEDVTSGYTSSEKCSNWPVQKCDVQKKQVKKFSPETKCVKVPVELCGPASCPAVPGPKECYQKKKTITGEKPGEECSLEPKRVCKFVTKLVPQLTPHESCVDVPKEVCVRSQTNPRKVQKPVLKKWCYTPSEESGLGVLAATAETDDDSLAQPAPQQCPRRCSQAIRNGQCDPSCESYTSICGPCVPRTTTPPPQCPAKCRDAIRRGNCDPTCNVYNSICGECTPKYSPPPKTTPPPPKCPSKCKTAIKSGICDPSCNIYENICGPCVPKTTSPPPQCPSKCKKAIKTGLCDPSCDSYSYICGQCVPRTTPPPPKCPAKCKAAIRTGNCDPSCNSFSNICGQCVPKTTPRPPQCPAKCRKAISTGNCDPSCNSYSTICGQCVPKTTPRPQQCPAKCRKAVNTGNCDPSCDQYNTICGRCTPITAPVLQGGYLPPPETSRSFSPQLRNSVTLQSKTQFARKTARGNIRNSSVKVSKVSKKKKKGKSGQRRGGRKDARPPTRRPRNNWDLYFEEGIVKKKG